MTTRKLDRAPETMSELCADLCEVYFEARNGKLKTEFVKEAANVAGKVIKGHSSLTEYSIARKEKPDNPFMK